MAEPNPTAPPNEGGNPIPAQSENSPAITQEVKVYDADYVKDLRTENANYRTRAKEAETKAANFETQISDLQTKLKQSALRASVAVEAGKLKIVDADAALVLMDKSGIEFSEDGSILGVEDALKKLIDEKKYLIGELIQTTPQGNPARSEANFTKEQLVRMSPQEINTHWEEVKKVLNN